MGDTVDVGLIDVMTAVGTWVSGAAVAEDVLEDLGVLEVRRDVDKVEFVPLVVLEEAEIEVPLGKGWADRLKMGAGVETLAVVESDRSVVLGWPTTDVPLKKGFGDIVPGSRFGAPEGDAGDDSVEAVVSAVVVGGTTDVLSLGPEVKLDDADGAAVDSAEEVVSLVEGKLEDVSWGTAVSLGFFGGTSERVRKPRAVELRPLADDEADDEVDNEVDDEVDTTKVLELKLDVCVSVRVLLTVVEVDTGSASDKIVVDSSVVLLVLDKVVSVLGSGNVDNVDAGASSSGVFGVVVAGAVNRPSITEGLELLLNKTSRSHFVPLRGPASTVAARKQTHVIRLPAVVRIASSGFGFGIW